MQFADNSGILGGLTILSSVDRKDDGLVEGGGGGLVGIGTEIHVEEHELVQIGK